MMVETRLESNLFINCETFDSLNTVVTHPTPLAKCVEKVKKQNRRNILKDSKYKKVLPYKPKTCNKLEKTFMILSTHYTTANIPKIPFFNIPITYTGLNPLLLALYHTCIPPQLYVHVYILSPLLQHRPLTIRHIHSIIGTHNLNNHDKPITSLPYETIFLFFPFFHFLFQNHPT